MQKSEGRPQPQSSIATTKAFAIAKRLECGVFSADWAPHRGSAHAGASAFAGDSL
jgi:hypothetical protein